ncbi:sulfatase family protein [Aquimarina algiphila]|uniref:sulfatase family protein n=1 Tax=Aquimarina algiphila TaxID=2047982 RepID=UPI002331434B|nr:arylsulfatase [Aquimarina algiphila]
MKSRFFISILIVLSSLEAFSQVKPKKPNVIVILADDIGLGDISGYRRIHSKKIIVETPQIDQLMQEGMAFTDAHSPTALCAPSRYSIMTGNNTYHSYAPWGVWGSYEKSPIKETDLTMGKLMKQADYNTAFFGKWHMGGDWYRKGSTTEIYRGPRWKTQTDVDVTQIISSGPKQNGFDYSFMYPAGIQDVPYTVYENEKWFPLNKNSKIGLITQKKMDKLKVKLDKDEGLGDTEWNPFDMGPLLINKAVDYINRASTEKPFFMYYCTQAVHKPHTPSESLNGKKIKGTTPVYHLDMIAELDAQMAMLVDALKKKGVYENTVIIFTSDNGGLPFKETLATGHRPSDIYRGGKNQIYEGGHRVPFIVVWPDKIKPNSKSSVLVSGTDIMAIIAAISNKKLSKNQAMDSANLLPVFLENSEKSSRKVLLIQGGTAKNVAYREGEWKLIVKYKKEEIKPIALFNLNTSPGEKEADNLINSPKHKERINRMFLSYTKIRDTKTPSRNL